MSINLTGTVLASVLFEHCNSICDKEGLVLGKVSKIVTDTISDSSINNVESQTVYYVHSFLNCEKLFSWYNSQGEVQTDALQEILARYNPEEVIGWYKLRQNSSLLPSVREHSIHRNLEDWLSRRNISRRLVFFLCVSNSTHGGALYTTDHQFMIRDDKKFRNMAINIVNLGNIAKPNYQSAPNFTCASTSLYGSTVNKLRSKFVNGLDELDSVKKVDLMKFTLHEQLKKVCAKLIKSEAELEKETAEVKRLQLQLISIEGRDKNQGHGKTDSSIGASSKQNSEPMDVEDEKPLMVFDDDEDDLETTTQPKTTKDHDTPVATINHSHLLDENREALDAIRLLDDDTHDAGAIKRQKQGTAEEDEPFEFLTDILETHSVAGSSGSYGLRSQANVSPEPDLRGGIGRTARRSRQPKQSKTEPDVALNAERVRKKVYEREQN